MTTKHKVIVVTQSKWNATGWVNGFGFLASEVGGRGSTGQYKTSWEVNSTAGRLALTRGERMAVSHALRKNERIEESQKP